MLLKLESLFCTLIYLKPIQVLFQVKNRLFTPGTLSSYSLPYTSPEVLDFLDISDIIPSLNVDLNHFHFKFLNLSQTYFRGAINWNDQSHGKLWNYNLQYLDYLKQPEIPLDDRIYLLKDIYKWLWNGQLRLEPYPASLRIMNVIRFLNSQEIDTKTRKEIHKWILAELNYLSRHLEYHLLANHLLENAFAFWMGAIFFKNAIWIKKAFKLLEQELKEQILIDGAHYELSPMYHRIILFRVLEAYHLTPDEYKLKNHLKEKAELMLGWMKQMSFEDNSMPHFNDSANEATYTPEALLQIAKDLNIKPREVGLDSSGYRSLCIDDLKMIVDVEGIKPSYQPGHAHADTFTFELRKGKHPIIIDTGISTYEIGERRSYERSTKAHNTVTINNKNSSQVWSSFRVGKRAKVTKLEDTEEQVVAQHNGFGSEIHKRAFKIISNGIEIKDEIINRKTNSEIVARYYFPEDITPKIINENQVSLDTNVSISFTGDVNLSLEPCEIAKGFNRLVSSYCLCAKFYGDSLSTQFVVSA